MGATAPTVKFVLSAVERPLIELLLSEDMTRIRYPRLFEAIAQSDHPTVSLSREDAETFSLWLSDHAAMLSQSSAPDDHQRSGVLKSAAAGVNSALSAS